MPSVAEIYQQTRLLTRKQRIVLADRILSQDILPYKKGAMLTDELFLQRHRDIVAGKGLTVSELLKRPSA
jgi:hypothetical protein